MTIRKTAFTVIPAALALAAATFAPVQAGILHRHPGATGVGAGLIAHHMAKHHGHGMMHRHPVMTGIAAGAVAHHMAKHH